MSCGTPPLSLDLLAFDFLSGTERRRVEEHAQGCPECRETLRRFRADRALVVRALAGRRPSRPGRLAWLAGAVAATLLVALGPTLFRPRAEPPPPRRIPEPAWETAAPPPPSPLPDLSPSLKRVATATRLAPPAFAAALRRRWPGVTAADLAAAETAAFRAVDRYRRRVARARDREERRWAEAELTRELERRISLLLALYGPPAPEQERPRSVAADPGKEAIVRAEPREALVLSGTPEELVRQVAWRVRDRIGLPPALAADLGRRWVAEARALFARTPPPVVASLRSRLVGGGPPDPAAASLWEELLDIQRRIEVAHPGATGPPTFFLFEGSEAGELDAVDLTPGRIDEQDAGDVEPEGVLQELAARVPVRDRG